MKIVTLALIAAALVLAQDKKAEARGSVAPAAASAPKLPSGAKEVEPGLYRYTDAQGKTWMYRNTPFGLAKWEDKPVAATALVVEPVVAVTTTDLGDSVQFVRQTPFGPQKWTKKKTDLTENEKDYVKKDESRRPTPQPPDKNNVEKPSAMAPMNVDAVGQPIQAADPLSSGSSRLKAGCGQDCPPHKLKGQDTSAE